jgi:hypothetical protein
MGCAVGSRGVARAKSESVSLFWSRSPSPVSSCGGGFRDQRTIDLLRKDLSEIPALPVIRPLANSFFRLSAAPHSHRPVDAADLSCGSSRSEAAGPGPQVGSASTLLCIWPQDGATSLFIASQEGHPKVVERIIAAGANVDKGIEVLVLCFGFIP